MNTVMWNTATRRTLLGFSAQQVAPFPTIAEEPVTVAEVLRHLKWSAGHPDEPDVPRWIATARTVIERQTRLALARQTWDLFLDDWGGVPGWIPLPLHPIVSLDDVVIVNGDLTETALVADDDYALVTGRRPGRLVFLSTPSLSAARVLSPIRIRYTAGYDDPLAIPVDLRHALLMMVADLATHRGDEREGWQDRSVPVGVQSLVQRYVLPEVA